MLAALQIDFFCLVDRIYDGIVNQFGLISVEKAVKCWKKVEGRKSLEFASNLIKVIRTH